MTVQPDFVGHGVGRVFHTTPYIFHVKNRFPGVMLPGLVFTIEPVICTGSPSFRCTIVVLRFFCSSRSSCFFFPLPLTFSVIVSWTITGRRSRATARSVPSLSTRF